MKCVKNEETLEVRRVSNEHAIWLVNETVGKWEYAPKSDWKALRVTPVINIVHSDEQKREIQRKADRRKHSNDKKNYRKS